VTILAPCRSHADRVEVRKPVERTYSMNGVSMMSSIFGLFRTPTA
jgi:hypothetical protein